MDTLALGYALLGFAIGGVASGFFLAMGRRSYLAKQGHRSAATALKLTSSWRLAELGTPLIVGRDIEAEVPAGSRVVASGVVAPHVVASCEVRLAGQVSADYALDAARGRALLFLGGVRSGSQALTTTDPDLVARLAAEAEALWQGATAYVEQRSLSDAAGRIGVPIEVQGLVADVIPRQGSWLVRLEDNGQALGVRVGVDAAELKGQRVVVRGRMERDGGYPVLVASDLRRIA